MSDTMIGAVEMCLEVRDDVVGNRESAPSVVNVERL